jgi:hypothetical protein
VHLHASLSESYTVYTIDLLGYKLLLISRMLVEYDFLISVLQALDSFKAESDFELTLSAGDIVIVRKVIYSFTTIVF